MSASKLYSPPDSFRTHRIMIAAKYSDVKNINAVTKDLEATAQSPEFLQKFPFAKFPAFETADGHGLFETSAIAQYVGAKVAGKDELSRAQVQQWVSVADNEFLPAVLGWVLPSVSVMQFNKQAVEAAKENLLALLTALNDYLLTRTYLVGERITLADITLSCNLLLAYEHVLEPSLRQPFVNVNRWFLTCVNQPQFKAVLGEVPLCNKATQFDANKLKAAQAKAGAAASPSGKKDKKGGDKKETPAKQEKKKDKKKSESEATAPEEMDATEAALAEEPKKKDPFDAFPKGNFNMDEFKRVYSNEDTLEKAIPYFWDHFDKENYSIWFCEYKYPEDLKQAFMSCNLMTGMMQRLDKMRKNAFGTLILFGENNASTISGVWFWRGKELAFELSPDWQVDYESYDWKQLDANAPETKELVKEYFAWEGAFGGKKFNQGKVFK